MMNNKLIVAGLLALGLVSMQANAKICKITDPTGTSLNVRDDINGQVMGKLPNGKSVHVLDEGTDDKNRPWLYISYNLGKQHHEGWVFREFVSCY